MDDEPLHTQGIDQFISYGFHELDLLDPEDVNLSKDLPFLVDCLYKNGGVVTEALAGDLITITSSGILDKYYDAYKDPANVNLLFLKIAMDLALSHPERMGLDKTGGEMFADNINRIILAVTDPLYKVFSDKKEIEKANKVTDQTINDLRQQGLLHLTRLEANQRFNIQSETTPTAPTPSPSPTSSSSKT